MKYFVALFLMLTAYGVYQGKPAAALMSASMIALVVYGDKQLKQRDNEFYASPQSAICQPWEDTAELLELVESESSRTY